MRGRCCMTPLMAPLSLFKFHTRIFCVYIMDYPGEYTPRPEATGIYIREEAPQQRRCPPEVVAPMNCLPKWDPSWKMPPEAVLGTSGMSFPSGMSGPLGASGMSSPLGASGMSYTLSDANILKVIAIVLIIMLVLMALLVKATNHISNCLSLAMLKSSIM